MSCLIQATGPNVPCPPYSNSRSNDSHYHDKCKTLKEIPPIHANIVKNGQKNDPFIVFELLRMRSRYNSIDYAFKVFQHIPKLNVYIYTALIDELVFSGAYLASSRIYVQMVEDFILPDNYVMSSVLKACGFQLDIKIGREIHGQAFKLGLCSNRSVKLKLMEFYGKCGEFRDAMRVFDEMPEGDVVASTVMISCYADHRLVRKAIDIFSLVKTKDRVCWTAMIDGLIRNGEKNKALEYFRQMQREGVRANEVTIVCILSACAQLGALDLGRWVHSYVEMHEVEVNHLVGLALINMYSRCGDIDEAEKIFKLLWKKDVTTYNSLIVGFALNGNSVEAVKMFQRMISGGVRPTNITFIGVLNACSHGGLVDLRFEIFDSIWKLSTELNHRSSIMDAWLIFLVE